MSYPNQAYYQPGPSRYQTSVTGPQYPPGTGTTPYPARSIASYSQGSSHTLYQYNYPGDNAHIASMGTSTPSVQNYEFTPGSSVTRGHD
jgi:hypothetical protein